MLCELKVQLSEWGFSWSYLSKLSVQWIHKTKAGCAPFIKSTTCWYGTKKIYLFVVSSTFGTNVTKWTTQNLRPNSANHCSWELQSSRVIVNQCKNSFQVGLVLHIWLTSGDEEMHLSQRCWEGVEFNDYGAIIEMTDSHNLTCINMQLRKNILNSLASFTRNSEY